MLNSGYLLKGHTAWLYFWDSYGWCLSQKQYCFVVTVCIASFEAIGELQRKRLRQSRAAVFCWNPRTCGQFLQAKSYVPSRSFVIIHTALSVTGTFHKGEVGIPCGGQCKGADFTKISEFPEILGELSMHKQCVSGSFFLRLHTRAEAKRLLTRLP